MAYALNDSPAGQLAWIVEKFKEWTDPASELPEDAVDRDQLLTGVSITWFTGAGASSAHATYEGMQAWRQMAARQAADPTGRPGVVGRRRHPGILPPPPHEGELVIDQVGLGVSDLERSRAFYEKALAPLGYQVLIERDGSAGFGNNAKPDFFIHSNRPLSGPTHVAIASPNGPIRGVGAVQDHLVGVHPMAGHADVLERTWELGIQLDPWEERRFVRPGTRWPSGCSGLVITLRVTGVLSRNESQRWVCQVSATRARSRTRWSTPRSVSAALAASPAGPAPTTTHNP